MAQSRFLFRVVAPVFALFLGLPGLWAQLDFTPAQKPLFSADDAKTLMTYRLDENKMLRFEAVVKTLGEQAKTDEALQKEMEQDEAKEQGVEKWAEAIEKEKPKLREVIKAANSTPRDFILTSYAITTAMVYADLLKSNALAPVPSYVPRENISFVRRFEDRLADLFAKVSPE